MTTWIAFGAAALFLLCGLVTAGAALTRGGGAARRWVAAQWILLSLAAQCFTLATARDSSYDAWMAGAYAFLTATFGAAAAGFHAHWVQARKADARRSGN
ncbi:hypothetical protein [Cryptosporangium japonicum]|uniref:Uncharacterized protein n=1 Tax=Cryptosporangium japonicum TaxID=80872 RepID=A0ABP3DHB8_9ACTN